MFEDRPVRHWPGEINEKLTGGSDFTASRFASRTIIRRCHHDDQADDGFLAIRGPEVSLGSPEVDWSGAMPSPHIYTRPLPASDTYQQGEGPATRLLRGALTAMAWRQSSSRGLARPSPIAPSRRARIGASVIDLLANSKIRLDSVKRMTQILNTS